MFEEKQYSSMNRNRLELERRFSTQIDTNILQPYEIVDDYIHSNSASNQDYMWKYTQK